MCGSVLEGRDQQRHWAPKQLGIALFRWRCWLAAAMGAFLPGSNAISAATATLGAAAILQPLSECTALAALGTASAKPIADRAELAKPIADHAELARRSAIVGCQHSHRSCHEDDRF